MKQCIYCLMAVVFIAGCSRYEYEQSDPGLTVTESILEFTAKGGEGYIVVESDLPIEAESNSDWCRIEVIDSRIDVTVDPYGGIENRTAVVSITAAGKDYPVNVPVTQSAARFIIENLSFDVDYVLTSVKTAVISEEEVTVFSPDEWIEAAYENDSIMITVALNMEATVRTGTVQVTSGAVSQTILVNQAERAIAFEDLLGDWEMTYQNFAGTATYTNNIHFSESATEDYYDVTGLGVGTLSIKFNAESKTLEVYGGSDMGPDPDDPSRTIVALVFTSDGYITWSSSTYYKGVWNKGFGDDMVFTFEDSGTYTGKTIFGLYIVSSNQYPVVTGSYLYTGFMYVNISMSKL